MEFTISRMDYTTSSGHAMSPEYDAGSSLILTWGDALVLVVYNCRKLIRQLAGMAGFHNAVKMQPVLDHIC